MNPGSADVCSGCGAVLARPLVHAEPDVAGIAADPPRRRLLRGIAAAPVAVLMLLGVLLAARQWEQRRGLAQAYGIAAAAESSGDYPRAERAFSGLGGYRDAPRRVDAVRAALAPFEARYAAGVAELDAGLFEAAAADLLAVVRDLPGYRDAAVLLEQARGRSVGEQLRRADVAESHRDWLAAARELAGAAVERPEDAEVAARLRNVRSEHAPFVYIRGGSVYTGGVGGSDERLIAAGKDASWLAWSPDQRRIAFVGYPRQGPRLDAALFVVDADGSDLRQVATSVLPYAWPSSSPDGTRIAFMGTAQFNRQTAEGRINLSIVDLRDGTVSDMTGDRFDYAASISWSPDGGRIAFVDRSINPSGTSGGGYFQIGGGDVQVLDVRTGEVADVTGTRIRNEFWVEWSPVGERLLVLTNPGDYSNEERGELFLLNLSDDSLEQVPTAAWRTGTPVWSPDGSRFAWRDGDGRVTVWTDGAEEWVTVPTDVGAQISWAQDGRSLLAPAATNVEPSYVIPFAERFGGRRQVAIPFDTGNGPFGPPQWSPRNPERRARPTISGTGLDPASGMPS
ncbi:MAG: TolB family protein [Thermomicrobiales bacterium]